MQSNTATKVEDKPEKQKVEVKAKDKSKKDEIVKEHIIKEVKCSIIDGGVNYII
jgi:hypothetical protein